MKAKILLLAITLTSLMGCSQKPEPIKYGTDRCEQCTMMITEKNFGAELITKKGKIFKFDSAECLKDYVKEHSDMLQSKFYFVNYITNKLISSEESLIVSSEEIRSPMGGGLAVCSTKEEIDKGFKGINYEIFTVNDWLKK